MGVPMQEREIRTFQDIIRALEEQPSLREQLRVLLLTRELLDLPRTVAGLAEAVSRLERQVERLAQAQERTEERLGRVEEQVGRLEEQVGRLEERADRLEEAVARLAEAQARTEERVGRLEEVVARLAEAQARTEEALVTLRQETHMHLTALGARWGVQSETAFRRAIAYFLERAGLVTERFVATDQEGAVLGRPSTVEVDVMARDGSLTVVEVKSSLSEGDVVVAERKAQFVSRQLGRPVTEKVLVSPFIDRRARSLARELGWKLFTGRGQPR